MKKWLLSVVALFFLGFSSQSIVLADEGHNHEEEQYLKDFSNTESTNEEDEVEAESHEHHDVDSSTTTEESDSQETHDETSTHEEMDTHDSHDSGHDSHGETSTEDAEHSGTDSSHTDSHEAEVEVESSPNYLVLAGFGVVNSAFLLIGVWNKVTKRREKKNGITQ